MKDNLYIIRAFGKNKETLIKLGYTDNIENRLNNYLSHNPFIEIISTFYREDAQEFEKLFHNYNSSCFKNEWYEDTMLIYILEAILKPIEFLIDNRVELKKLRNKEYKKRYRDKNKEKCKIYNKMYREKVKKKGSTIS